jgi:hypothetical protein
VWNAREQISHQASPLAATHTPQHTLSEPFQATMFVIPSFKLPFLNTFDRKYPTIDLPSVEIHDVETAAEKRPRTLKHLLKANHANFSIIYHKLQFHNHTPHVCYLNASSNTAAKNLH